MLNYGCVQLSVVNCVCGETMHVKICPCSTVYIKCLRLTVYGSYVSVLWCSVIPSAFLPFLFCRLCFSCCFSSVSFLTLRCTAIFAGLLATNQPTTSFSFAHLVYFSISNRQITWNCLFKQIFNTSFRTRAYHSPTPPSTPPSTPPPPPPG